MVFVISVFNSISISPVDPKEVLAAITDSNYDTLCAQYGLDSALIDPSLSRLDVLAAPDSGAPFFTVIYRQGGDRPIVVQIQDRDGNLSEDLSCVAQSAPASVQEVLPHTAQVISIELEEDQLQDLGLLIGYELARWAAVKGNGVMRALDGRWYRLNANKAFLPVEYMN